MRTLTPNQLKYAVIAIPIVFSFIYAFFCYLFALASLHSVTPAVQQALEENAFQVFWVSLLILIPNMILSLIMYIYSNTANFTGNRLLIPCFTSILFGLIPVLYTYYFFYSQQSTSIAQVSVMAYGFPFVYFFGMMIGFVVGIFTVAFLSKNP